MVWVQLQFNCLQRCVHLRGFRTLGQEGLGLATGTARPHDSIQVQLPMCHQRLSWGW